MEVYADIFSGHYEGNLMLEKPYFLQLEVCSQHFEKQLLASSCLSVHPYLCMEQRSSQWTDFN